MKKILTILVACTVMLSMIGCGINQTTMVVSTDSDSISDGALLGHKALIGIGDGLWYDQSTRIVYWWNGFCGTSQYATAPSPYYAPNGLPYRYNPSTNTFEEIKD